MSHFFNLTGTAAIVAERDALSRAKQKVGEHARAMRRNGIVTPTEITFTSPELVALNRFLNDGPP